MAQTADSSDGLGRRIRELWAWWPARLAMLGFLVTAIWVIGHEAGLFSPTPPPGVAVDLPRVSATVEDGSVALDLPYTVLNGTEDTLRSVSVWVNVYACRSAASPTSQCMKVHSSEQQADLTLAAGASAQLSDHLALTLPDDRPGDAIRVEREVNSIVNQADLDNSNPFRKE